MFKKILLLIILNICLVSSLNTSLNFKYANIQYEETNEVQILRLNNGTINYIIIRSEDDDQEGIFRLGIQHMYKNYCDKKCKIFAKPLNNTGVVAREIIRFIELFNPNGDKSLIKYLDGNESTTGCIYSNTKILQSTDTLETIPLDGLFYTDSSSSYSIVNNFNDVSIKFGALEEKTPLARAEWLKFISVFYGYEREATQLFNEIEENYNCNKLLVKNNQHLLTPMRVAWLSRASPDQELWIMNDFLYKTELLNDAGADVLTIRENSIDNLHNVLKNVHFVIDDTESTDGTYTMEDFYKNYEYNDDESKMDVLFLSKNNVLTNDGARSSTNVSAWREDYLVYPHLVLVDLIYWFHPKLPVAKYFKFEIENNKYDHHYWFRNIATNSPIHMTSNTKCPTEIPDILTQTICINLDGFGGDYKDYYSFDDKKTRFKKYIRMYWYLVAFCGCFLMGLIATIRYFYKGKMFRRLKNRFSKKNLRSVYEDESIANHEFFILEDEDFE